MPAALPQVHIGCSGWFYWGWRGRFYPRELPTHRWFSHYIRHFKTVELNAPFYSWPKRSAVRGWLRQVPSRAKFLYSVKASRMITHEHRMEGTAMLVDQFYIDVAEALDRRMGCVLFQFPPSFRFTRKRLKTIMKQLDPGRARSVVEFRHKSWWNGEVYRGLRRRGIIFCSISAPRLPETLVKTADDIYVRLHGTSRWYRHDYSRKELAAWALKIRGSGATAAWIYFDNDRDAHSIKNARALRRMLTATRSAARREAPRAAPGASTPGRRV